MDIKTISDLMADYEKTTDNVNKELVDLKATMFANFGADQEKHPVLIDGTENSVLSMFVKIIQYYIDVVDLIKQNPIVRGYELEQEHFEKKM